MKRNLTLFFYGLMMFCTVNAQHTEKIYLSGTGNDHTVNWDFYCTNGMNAGKWTTIPVPSNWELQGFGKYDYGFAKDSIRGKEEGHYKYRFKVPANWSNKQINIVFEGSMTDTEVKINGVLAGEIHQGAFYVFKYNISKLLKYGTENLLEVRVSKHSANQSVNEAERKADFWIFGGIFRPVYLEALPNTHFERIQLDAKANGLLSGKLAILGNADKLEVQLYQKNGAVFGEKIIVPIKSNTSTAYFSKQFSDPKLWSSEFPNLYTAKFNLFKAGKVVHSTAKKIGFRTIEVKERDGIFVNGVKMKFKGVNRHSFYPSSGRTTSKKISIADVLLMKSMNMNAVRMSHYPPDSHFLDVCDSLGLYVMDELAGWHGSYDTATGTKLLKEMMVNDENHPSIVIWANGNEGGHNRDLDPIFLAEDFQKRAVIHPWEVFGGFETTHYREFNYGIGNYDHGHNIIMPTEFLHGMFDGGHGAGIEDYWNAMWQNPLSAGGFLWDFADQGVVRTDRNGEIDTDGNRGPDGIVGPYHEKEGSYYTIKEVWSPVFFEKRAITAAFDGVFNVENRYSFTNLNQCSFEWELRKFGKHQDLKTGKAISPNVKPYEKGKVKVNLIANWRDYDVLYITAKSPGDELLFTWSFPIVLPKDEAAKLLDKEANTAIKSNETDKNFEVSANGIHLTFNKLSGMLEKVANNGSSIPFNNGPVLQEGVNNFKDFTLKKNGNEVIIASTFNRKESYNTLQWIIYPSGIVKMEVNYFPSAYFTTFVGLNFSYPETEIKGIEYMGNGPNRVWKNRMKGNKFGVWLKDYNNAATGEVPFKYPEFKGYYSNLYWCKVIGKTHTFKVFTDREDVFLRLFTPKKSKDTEWDNMSPTFPNGDISFMNGISAIGTKTQKPETTGPMGMKHIFYDFEKEPARALNMTLYFDFSDELAHQ
ncbi:glycoside hydrolase family 2 protein [Pedobacter insulae]|uniref:beta-galactosidase n=1 Tax=Pedobacter insulae TaxID=414048 RepID=A0A1I2YFR2_9SPHI|nr:glycoside hydrolase family 2 TIM barrel-domain containing protein [Pedobacter insulae]SFH24473.1 Beta-galactosidase/beta-glucuronidase [Pedobacter insulae]